MDSGNSGSLQSSSGGDDEFDSRGGGGGVDSSPLSALLRPSPSPSAAAFSLHGSYYGLQEFTSAPRPHQQQQAGAWSGSFAATSGVSSPRVAHTDATGARPQSADTAVASTQGQQRAGTMGGAPPAPAQPPPRGSRKRTRASRRAPTTVLTTNTSNFRAMVQEFTGIPSPPFGAGGVGIGLRGPAAASLRTRFDHIFPPPSSLRSGGTDATGASLPPPYLLRPFPHKLPTSTNFPPFTSSSSSSTPSSSNIGVANANAATGTATTASASSTNPVAPTAAAADTFQQITSSALLRLQQDSSSYLSFQNLLDSQGSSLPSIFGAAAGFGQSSRLHDPAPSPSDFLAGGVGSSGLGLGQELLGAEGMHLHHSRSDVHGHGHGGDELSGVVAAGASGGGSCKLNYSHAGAAATSSSAAASGEKQPDGGGGGAPVRPGRGDGSLDPWICTSE